MHLALALAFFAAWPEAAQSTPARVSPPQKAVLVKNIAAAIDDAGFKYRKADDGVWVISFRGQNAASLEIVVKADPEMVVVLSTVKKKALPSPRQLRQLLEANYKANYSKLAIDNDGDLLSLIELPPDVTAGALRTAVDEVASLADTAFGLISSNEAVADSATSTSSSSENLEMVPAGTGATMALLRGAFELSYDPAKWRQQATTDPGTTQLNHVSGELWLKVIAERIEVGPEALRSVAVSNAKAAAPEIHVDSETWRTVNGLKVLVLRYGGNANGIRFTFYNQMYSDSAGIVQLAGWTTTNLFDEHRRDLLELFAGFRKVR
jgi:hypothetical protein